MSKPAPLADPVATATTTPTAVPTATPAAQPAAAGRARPQPLGSGPKPSAPLASAPTGSANKQIEPAHVQTIGRINSMPAVREMQQAIYNFAQAAMGMDALKMQQSGKQETGANEYLGGHDPVNKFMFNNYLNTAKDKTGKGFLSVENLNVRDRLNTALSTDDQSSLRNWIETIRHIGSPSANGEYQPDGQWGERTNNGLRAIAGFAQMMIGFAKDMGVDIGQLTKESIDQFASKIPSVDPKTHVVNGDVSATAKGFAQFIEILTGIVSNFKKNLMDNPSYKNYLSSDKPLLEGGTTQLDKNESAISNLNDDVELPLPEAAHQNGFTKITLKDLASKDNFSAYLKKMNIPSETTEDFTKALNLVRSYLDKAAQL